MKIPQHIIDIVCASLVAAFLALYRKAKPGSRAAEARDRLGDRFEAVAEAAVRRRAIHALTTDATPWTLAVAISPEKACDVLSLEVVVAAMVDVAAEADRAAATAAGSVAS